MKQTIRLTESELRKLISNKVRKYLRESGTQRYGHKHYYNDSPEDSKQIVSYGDIRIRPDEYDRLADTYDEDLGYYYKKPNPEPVCCDPIEGPCYDTGEYVPNDADLQDDYAKYADRQNLSQDTNPYKKRRQMNNDFAGYDNRHSWDKDSGEEDMNLNVKDFHGSLSRYAQSDDPFTKSLGQRFKGTYRSLL